MADLFSSINGDDVNGNGSILSPYRTIQKSIDNITPGGIVWLRGGRFFECPVISKAGLPSSPITIQNYNGEPVTVDATGVDGYWAGIFSVIGYWNPVNYITLKGLRLVNNLVNIYGVGVFACYTWDHLTLLDIYVEDVNMSGILAVSASSTSPTVWGDVLYLGTNLLVDGCELYHTNHRYDQEGLSLIGVDGYELKNTKVHDTVDPYRIGVCCKGYSKNGSIHDCESWGHGSGAFNPGWTNQRVYNNKAHDCGETGFVQSDEAGNGVFSNIWWYNNLAWNCQNGYALWSGATAVVGDTKFNNINIVNNTGFNNGWAEMRLRIKNGNATNVNIRNNIFNAKGAGNNAMLFDDPTLNVVPDHNLCWNPDGFGGQNTTFGTNAVIADPKFVNPPSDFHLQSGSPAIDAGSGIGAPADDFDGVPRPYGIGFDIGAYEFVPSGFQHGSVHTTNFQLTEKPTVSGGYPAQVEVWLGPNDSTKSATSGLIPFTINGSVQNFALPITMPAAGVYNVYRYVYAGGYLIDYFVDSQPVTVV